MSREYTGLIIVILISVFGSMADGLLKAASLQVNPFWNRWVPLALLVLLGCAFGWIALMHYMKLATAGVLYALISAVFIACIGVFVFGERLTVPELTGMAMAVGAIALLSRTAG